MSHRTQSRGRGPRLRRRLAVGCVLGTAWGIFAMLVLCAFFWDSGLVTSPSFLLLALTVSIVTFTVLVLVAVLLQYLGRRIMDQK